MFIVLLRFLLILGATAAVLYFLYKWINRVLITDEQKTKLEDALIHIKESIKESESIPQIDTDKLKKVHDHIDQVLKHSPKKKKG